MIFQLLTITISAEVALKGSIQRRDALALRLLLGLILSFSSANAVTTNAILFVTQVSMPTEINAREITSSVVNVSSAFGNHLGDTAACGRGGALWIRYSNGSVANLTQLAGYGTNSVFQGANSIAVREPSVHWSGTKALFSMVVGAPSNATDTTKFYWQIYEVTNFIAPIITHVPNQPTNYNNVSPTYGSNGRIIFASDRPRDGQAHLYPQREEYLQLPTVTGLWSLDPQSGDLVLLEHSPSGSFKPFVDSFGRVIFTRWDHLARDVEAVTDRAGTSTNNMFNWSDESVTSTVTTSTAEVFPEPRPSDQPALAGTNLRGNAFNLFLPWQVNEDGTAEEIVNHVGRHELFQQVQSSTFTNDPNIVTLNASQRFNTNFIVNSMFQMTEDPNTPGLLYGVDAPDIGTHAAGKIVTLTANINTNPDFMVINYITTNNVLVSGGLFRNPVALSNGIIIATYTSSALMDTNIGTATQPKSRYDFRLKSLKPSGPYFVPDKDLTPGFTNSFSYYVGSTLVTNGGPLWELDPVEVAARHIPTSQVATIASVESNVFVEEGVDIPAFQNYLRSNNYAVVVSRNVTARDHADRQQPFNLKITGSTTQTIATNGTMYQLAHLQLMQADLLRSFKPDGINPAPGRRVLAQPWHDSVDDNPPNPSGPPGSTQLGADGSFAVILPARRAMSWQTVDTNGMPIVRERYWVTFQPGEIRSCANCHGINTTDQIGRPKPTNEPQALHTLLQWWKAVNAGPNTGRIVFQTSRDVVGGVTNMEIYAMNPDSTGLTNLTQNASADAIPRVSYNGAKVAFMSDRGHPGNFDVWTMNSDGSGQTNITQLNLTNATLWSAAFSPDNSKLVYMGPRAGNGYDIYLINADGTGKTNLTANTGDGSFPYWSYDGKRIVFSSSRVSSNDNIFIMNSDGSNQQQLTTDTNRDFYAVINRAGTKIAFCSERDGHRQIYLMNPDGTGQTNISNNAYNENTPYFSPDGSQISFTSDRDGKAEIYTMNADGSNQIRLTYNSVLEAYPSWGATPPGAPPLSPFDLWRQANFTLPQIPNPNIGGETADPDGDGLVNLVEYALGLSPNIASAGGAPSVGQTNGFLSLTYTKMNGATDILYIPEVSADLITWNNGPAFISESTLASNSVFQTIEARDLLPLSAANNRFIRLHVVHP